MAQESCVLLSNAIDQAQVWTCLKAAFGDKVSLVEGTEAEWRIIQVTRRKLLSQAQIDFVAMSPTQLTEVQLRLKHVFSSVHPEHPALMPKLIAKIMTSRMAIEVNAPKGFRGLEDVMFELSKSLDALIFWGGNKILNAKGHLVMDFEGRSGVEDLDVVVDAQLLDHNQISSEEGLARKAQTEALLKAREIAINKNLPLLPPAAELQLRSLEAIAQRAISLLIVAVRAEGLELEIVQRIIEDFGAAAFLSPQENAFLANPEPSQQDKINFIWRYESLATLLWALGYQADLAFPVGICDVGAIVQTMQTHGTYPQFLTGATMRSPQEILDAADLIYRLHWAVVDARLRKQTVPGQVEPGVVYERHYALNWLIQGLDQDWDEVQTHT